MEMDRRWALALAAAGMVACSSGTRTTQPSSPSSPAPSRTPKEALGALLFADPNLSEPAGQSCADCHAPTDAFSDPETDHSTSAGAVAGRAGFRNAPTAMYARYAPPLRFDQSAARFVGGLFWDGRADTLEAQAALPLVNPIEMNNADKASVAAKVRRAAYAQSFRDVFGATALDDDAQAFAHVTEAIAAYERSAALAPFSSKYDRYLAGTATLTAEEQRGLSLFEDPARGNCASCHPSRPAADGTPPLFTNFTYANLGVPRYGNSLFFLMPAPFNPDGAAFVDHGLMRTTGDAAQDGKFRVPTLRNAALTGPYLHNGYFENLASVIDFHNTRDGQSPYFGTWPAPEVAANLDGSIGKLGLSQNDVLDLVAFLNTLTDDPPAP